MTFSYLYSTEVPKITQNYIVTPMTACVSISFFSFQTIIKF